MENQRAVTNGLIFPARSVVPRTTGLTMVIDSGLTFDQFKSYIDDFGHLIDFVKFGWTTGYIGRTVTEKKISYLRVIQSHIVYYFGGTFLELAASQGKLEVGINFIREMNATHIEVSDGTIKFRPGDKVRLIERLVDDGFIVLSEVGYKDPSRSSELSASAWADAMNEELKAGSTWVIAETRKDGTGGLARADGHADTKILRAIIDDVGSDNVIFEAGTTKLQTDLFSILGTADINFGNINMADLLGLETLRLKARSDTMDSSAIAII